MEADATNSAAGRSRLHAGQPGTFNRQRLFLSIPNLDLQKAELAVGILDGGEMDLLITAEVEYVTVGLQNQPLLSIVTASNLHATLEVPAGGIQDQRIAFGFLFKVQGQRGISSGKNCPIEDLRFVGLYCCRLAL